MGAFIGVIVVALLVVHGWEIKKEIDLLEIFKISLLAVVVLLFRRYQEKRDRARQGEQGQLLTIIDDTLKNLSAIHRMFRVAEITERGVVAATSRDQLVMAFDVLDSQILVIERMLHDCDCSSPDDRYATANEHYNDVLMRNGLNSPVTSRPAAEEAYRDLHLALWRTRLRIVRM